ncbi:hypothetical protein IE077_004290 [Cardiosporidium cionae]|uniref:U4/U6.U5 small nuclear ribonucleoprotein 27kDa protein domain-containing protein n=1 Tax=Cardiosporidium cionae TaxID=476202 RepID=A0ABQ7JCK0_9APIC|nr:hypothetical protein IE077_004290 [Cardiosporidium cionae]|eukprot:KAF8821709.1 hypothetical protein IE077_004290 [Cardiosporidium cionae]
MLAGGNTRRRLRSPSNSASDRSFVSNSRACKDRTRGNRIKDSYRAKRGCSPNFDRRHHPDPRDFRETDGDRLHRSNYHPRLRSSVSPRANRLNHDSYRAGRQRRSPSVTAAAHPGGTVASAQYIASRDKNQQKSTTLPSSSLKRSASGSSSSGEERVENDLTEEQLLRKLLGFSEFDSSKGKEHGNSDLSGVNRKTKRRYRQYMNRKGGFNRPLSPTF